MENEEESLIERLRLETKWSPEAAPVGVRAEFRCEYCGLDFLANPWNYKLIQIDHIVPLSEGGSRTDYENQALACVPCNYNFKRWYNPRKDAGSEADRAALIAAASAYIQEQMKKTEEELVELRTIVGDRT